LDAKGTRLCRLCLLLVIATFFELQDSLAEGGARSALQRINAEVEEEAARLEELARQKVLIERRLHSLSSDIEQVRAREENLNEKLDTLAGQQSSLSVELLSLEKDINNLEALSLRRLRALYMTGAAERGHRVFASSPVDLQKQAFYLGKIRDFDRKLLNERAKLLQEKSNRGEELAAVLEDQQEVRQRLSEERRALVRQAGEQENLRRDLISQEAKIRASVTALRAQALRLETVVVSLTGPGADQGQNISSPAPRPGSQTSTTAPLERFSGPGLASQSALQMPVKGKLLRGFGGKSTERGFSDMVMSRGLLLSAPEDAPVFAVATGQVLHSGRMPGFGSILIVDHGERYYSLYGRLAAQLVQRGQLVERGQQIASVSAADPTEEGFKEGNGTFYFEIRKDGLPVDPRNYLNWSFE